MTMILAGEALVLGGLLLGLAAVAVAVQGLDHAPRCRDCKAATDVEETEVLGARSAGHCGDVPVPPLPSRRLPPLSRDMGLNRRPPARAAASTI